MKTASFNYSAKFFSILFFSSLLTACLQGSNDENFHSSSVAQAQPIAPPSPARESFEKDTIVQIARELSRTPYQNSKKLENSCLANLDYDEFRKIRFKPESAIWKSEKLPFQLQLLHRGATFQDKVEIAIIEGNKITEVPYDSNFFSFDGNLKCDRIDEDIGYSGFRVHFPLNTEDYFDELIVFQGASYFRALGKGNVYGISARGLAINTGEPTGEEFPYFKKFWIEKPAHDADQLIIHALLDSPSVTGAFHFVVHPGENTEVDVEATLFPRVKLDNVGLAPLTSMFHHSMNGREGVDDFRPEVHDSDGLLIFNGQNEQLWRPLSNPDTLQTSAFVDNSLQGFGLLQRDRSFQSYEDLEANYEKRPSVWVSPEGDWGKGSVVLMEIPTESEIHDNITAYWKSDTPLNAGNEFHYAYRMLWGDQPVERKGRLFVSGTARGRADLYKPNAKRLFVIDYSDSEGRSDKMPEPIVNASSGKVENIVIRNYPAIQGYRLSFELDEWEKLPVELRVDLKTEDSMRSETWLYRLAD